MAGSTVTVVPVALVMAGVAAADWVARLAGMAVFQLQGYRATNLQVPNLPLFLLASAHNPDIHSNHQANQQSTHHSYHQCNHQSYIVANHPSVATETAERLSPRIFSPATLPKQNNCTGLLTTGHLTSQCRVLSDCMHHHTMLPDGLIAAG